MAEEATRAFLDLHENGAGSGAAAVSWVAGHPRFAALSRPARAKAWAVVAAAITQRSFIFIVVPA